MALSPKMAALVAKAKANHAATLAASQAQAQQTSNHNGHNHVTTVSIDRGPNSQAHTSLHLKEAEEHKTVSKIFTSSSQFQPTIQGFEYNEKQSAAIELAMRGKSLNLIGAAGTGKTTTTREVIGQLSRLSHIAPLTSGTKYLTKDSPGIVVISFTNKAVNNLKRFLSEELRRHCMTYHKLLEYGPVWYDVEGQPGKRTMRFEPTYNGMNQLPHISCIIVEESSMVSEELHKILRRALPDPDAVQWIFLGDLNQLPPIFGPSILGFSLLELPTVELTHVYRQALESPIITLAHKVREGKGIGFLKETGFKDDRGEHGIVTLYPWRKKLNSGSATLTACDFIGRLIDGGKYNPEEDMLLCPFNKSFGTIELNKFIATKLGKIRDADVYEVIARYTKSYWAVGDRVLVDRQEAIITKIAPTPGYTGALPQTHSKMMDRWGKINGKKAGQLASQEDDDAIEEKADAFEILDSLVVGGNDEDTTNDSSHQVSIEFIDTGIQRTLTSAGDINGMLFSYVLTVHKSQGSEWKRVFIFLHYSHNTMLSRELMYTAITRARHELFIVCEPDRGQIYNSLTRAALAPEIQGVTLAEKAEYFKAKKKSMQRLADKKGVGQRDVEDMEGDE